MPNILNNDKYLISNNASISNLKNSYNKFISDLKDTSIENLIVNPLMQHKMASSTSPYEWDLEAGLGNGQDIDVITDGFYPQLWFYNPLNYSQKVAQNVTLKLQPATVYTLAVEIYAEKSFKFQILTSEDVNGIEKLIDLKNNNIETNILESTFITVGGGLFREHFYFKTDERNVFHSIIVRIVNEQGGGDTPSEPNNKLTLKTLNLFKGSIEFTEGVIRNPFLENVRYDSNSPRDVNGAEPADKTWKLTNDGYNYRPILLAGDVTGTIDLSGKVDKSTFFSEHDYYGSHQVISFTDSKYKITYNMKLLDGTFDTIEPKVNFDISSDENYKGVWQPNTTYGESDIVKHNNIYWKSLSAGNINHDPNIYSESWIAVPPVTKFYVTEEFPAIQKAYYNEHIGSGDSDNGKHVISHISNPSLKYTFNYSDTTYVLPSPSVGYKNTDTDARNITVSYSVEHSNNGNHNIGNFAPTAFNIITPSTQYGAFTFNLTKGTEAKVELSKVQIGTFVDKFTNDNVTISHDSEGNHVVNDLDGLQYKIKVQTNSFNNPSFVFVPKPNYMILSDIFKIFRQEHDKYGRHVLRDTLTGIFYYLTTDGTNFILNRTIFEPVETIDQMLDVFNTEHGISINAGVATMYHYFKNAAGTKWYAYDHLTGNFTDLTVTPTVTKNPLYHTDLIYYLWDEHTIGNQTILDNSLLKTNRAIHNNTNTQIHKFYITNGVLYK